MYLLDPNPETMALRGRMCRVYAGADGDVEILHEGHSLPFRVFNELRRVTRADILSNKRLAVVLTQIQADQRARNEQTLTNAKVTLREKRRIRAARARADAPPTQSQGPANPGISNAD